MKGRIGCSRVCSLQVMCVQQICFHGYKGEHSPGPGGQHLPCGSRTAVMQMVPLLSVADLSCERVSKTQWDRAWELDKFINILLNFENLSWLFPGATVFLYAAVLRNWWFQVSAHRACTVFSCEGFLRDNTLHLALLSDWKWVLLSLQIWFYYWIALKKRLQKVMHFRIHNSCADSSWVRMYSQYPREAVLQVQDLIYIYSRTLAKEDCKNISYAALFVCHSVWLCLKNWNGFLAGMEYSS